MSNINLGPNEYIIRNIYNNENFTTVRTNTVSYTNYGIELNYKFYFKNELIDINKIHNSLEKMDGSFATMISKYLINLFNIKFLGRRNSLDKQIHADKLMEISNDCSNATELVDKWIEYLQEQNIIFENKNSKKIYSEPLKDNLGQIINKGDYFISCDSGFYNYYKLIKRITRTKTTVLNLKTNRNEEIILKTVKPCGTTENTQDRFFKLLKINEICAKMYISIFANEKDKANSWHFDTTG